MPELGTAWITVAASTRGMEGDIKRALNRVDGAGSGTRVGQQFAQAATSSAKFDGLQSKLATAGRVGAKALGGALTVGVAAAAAGIAGTLGAAFTKGFDRLRTIDDAKFKLKALGNSAGDVQKIMDSALASVKGTAFGLGDAATVAANAVAAGVKPGEELSKYLTLTADAAAVAGTNLGDMGRIINQVRTGQKAYTEDLNQLADRGIPIYQWLAEETGVAAGEIKKLASEGGISAAMFEAAIAKHIGGAALTMGQSFSGSVENAQAALGRLGEAFLKPVFGNAAGGIGSITTALDGVTAWINEHQDTIIGFWETMGQAALTGAENFAHGIGGALQALGDLVGGLGNVKGVLDSTMAFFADLRGDEAGAAEFRKSAQEAFGWGESIRAAGDKLVNANFDESRQKVSNWAAAARTAAAESRNAAGEVAGLGSALGVLPKVKDIQITVDATQAQRVIDEFFNRNSNRTLPVGINPNIPSAGGNPLDVIAGRAGGGPISGPGGPKSDIIPIWASNGEHMLSARDVDAMGGQDGVYAFRNALHRAGGGATDNVDAMLALAQASSGRTAYAPASDLINGLADCSGSISDLVEILQTGKTSPSRLFTTTNFASDAEAAKLGFLPGFMPGAFNVGVNPYPGSSGHMAATLPNGVNFEGGGGTGGGALYGGTASGATDPQFEKQYYLPVARSAESAGMDLTRLYADNLAAGGQTVADDMKNGGAKNDAGAGLGENLGQSLISGLLQGLGLDGSVFSNPMEWPNVKSGLALANWGGGLLKSFISAGQPPEGSSTGPVLGSGGGGSLPGLTLPGVSDFIKPLSPTMGGSPVGGGGTGAMHTGTGVAPGPSVVVNGNVGMDPRAFTQRVDAAQNQAWRRNMTAVRP